MKKIITFLFCTVLLSSAFAQNYQHDRNDNYAYDNLNNNQYHDQYNIDQKPDYRDNRYSVYQKQEDIKKTNVRFNYDLQRVLNDRTLSRREKRRIIKSLQNKRDEQISRINYQYSYTNHERR